MNENDLFLVGVRYAPHRLYILYQRDRYRDRRGREEDKGDKLKEKVDNWLRENREFISPTHEPKSIKLATPQKGEKGPLPRKGKLEKKVTAKERSGGNVRGMGRQMKQSPKENEKRGKEKKGEVNVRGEKRREEKEERGGSQKRNDSIPRERKGNDWEKRREEGERKREGEREKGESGEKKSSRGLKIARVTKKSLNPE